ncbi:MAG: ThiF family adenylyltransferase [Capsulimonas sp.]|uniref:HesA/MoeB/ThiF family protein n=1 Tax=Capsulimonas sp. TaxID=2494211 RepID=UPI003267C1A9
MSRTSALYHEELYRTDATMHTIRDLPVTICGAGALGANIAENLARQGFGRLRVIDHDRVEERNLSTQPYYRSDIGAGKAKILANTLYRALGVTVETRMETLASDNIAKLLAGSALVIDAFDNSAARAAVTQHCLTSNIPCLHAGLANGYAEVLWNDGYRVPSPSNDDVCDYPLARNLVMITVAVACECTVAWAANGEKRGYTVTLGDLAVRAVA